MKTIIRLPLAIIISVIIITMFAIAFTFHYSWLSGLGGFVVGMLTTRWAQLEFGDK